MLIGVNGASGKLGATVFGELTRRVHQHGVIALSRTPRNGRAPFQGRLADYDRPETLARAYDGLDRLLLIPSHDLDSAVRTRQLTAAIDAAVAASVNHIVLVSTAGIRQAPEHTFDGSYWAIEQRLMRSPASWTILRMNYYAENMAEEMRPALAGGVLRGLGAERVAYVSRDDMAAALAAILLGDSHAGAVYHATGPRVVSGEERARLASDVAGRSVRFEVATQRQLREDYARMGLPDPVAEAIIGLKSKFLSGAFDVVTGDVARLAGRPAKTFREILAAAHAAA